MKIRTYLILIIAVWFSLPMAAQDDSRQLYIQAEENYNMGRIEEAKRMLENNIGSIPSSYRLRTYRLLSLCSLALDQEVEAEEYAEKMLAEDPHYTPTIDYPPRFIDLVSNLRKGLAATITTASSQAENLNEVPVPTTLITEEMIRNSGARNLQEVLAAYVPGMHIVDCNDDINIAMRGIYSNGQEKILIMLNGHRLNSYATNIASPDFSMSLEKLKQIEVLRGPASSLYGGVALTAVVNLITKQGNDVDGIEVKGGIGNYGQLRGDILFGKRYFDLDLLIWGSIYKNKGEEREVEDRNDIWGMPYPTVTIGRIGDKPSYDFGLQMKWNDLTFLYNNHFSQIVAPFTVTTLATSYAHDKYKTFSGLAPSFATRSSHASLSYNRQFNKLNLTGTLTYDNSNMSRYQVFYDDYMDSLTKTFGIPSNLDSLFSNSCGTARFINGIEHTIGAQLRGDINYINNGQHKGLLTFGADFSHFNIEDMRFQLVYDFTNTTPENYVIENLGKDHENSFDIFAQVKHQWQSFILNAGLRYDYKRHYDHHNLRELSPRVALIYVKPKWNAKISYSKAFVDAPYFYRKVNDFNMILEGENPEDSDIKLNPEILHSFQLTFAGLGWVKGLDFELNGFFNKANEQISTFINHYYNGGLNQTMGLELMAKYRHRRFTADFNFTWTHTDRNRLLPEDLIMDVLIPTTIDDNNNTPVIMSNAVLTWKPMPKLKLFSHISFQGRQSTYNIDVVRMTQASTYLYYAQYFLDIDQEASAWYLNKAMELLDNSLYKEEMEARAIVNLGAEYNIGRLTLGFNIHNLFNTHYYQSGMNTKLVPQKGRWLMGTIAYKF